MTTAVPPNSGPPLRALAMVLIALAIVFAGLGALSLSNSSSTSAPASATTPTTTSVVPTTPAATPDKTLPVAVYNAGTESGLAGRIARQLVSGGWTKVSAATNYTESEIDANAVYYDSGNAVEQATANEIAGELKYGTAQPKSQVLVANLPNAGIVVMVVTKVTG